MNIAHITQRLGPCHMTSCATHQGRGCDCGAAPDMCPICGDAPWKCGCAVEREPDRRALVAPAKEEEK